MIHCNMLFTFVLKCTASIGFYIFVLTGGLNDENNVINNKKDNHFFIYEGCKNYFNFLTNI
jgi:hypothetical protein